MSHVLEKVDVVADAMPWVRLGAGRPSKSKAWAMLFTHKGLAALELFRFRQWANDSASRPRLIRKPLLLLSSVGRVLLVMLGKLDITMHTQIGRGVMISSRGNIICGAISIGDGTVLQHAVTIGMGMQSRGMPTLHEKVWVGTNSIVSGGIEIGEGAVICENSVVTRNVPPRTMVAGNPAKVVARDVDNSPLLANPWVGSDLIRGQGNV